MYVLQQLLTLKLIVFGLIFHLLYSILIKYVIVFTKDVARVQNVTLSTVQKESKIWQEEK